MGAFHMLPTFLGPWQLVSTRANGSLHDMNSCHPVSTPYPLGQAFLLDSFRANPSDHV